MINSPVVPIYPLLGFALAACSGAAPTEELEGPARQVIVQEGGTEIPISAALRGRFLDRRPPPEGIREIDASWLALRVRFHNSSSDTLRLAYADTGCMIEVGLSPTSAGREVGPVWHGPVGCNDVTRLSRLLPDQQDTADAYLTTIDQIFGDSLQPGPYSIEATLRLGIEKYTDGGWETLVADTAVVLALEGLELPHRR